MARRRSPVAPGADAVGGDGPHRRTVRGTHRASRAEETDDPRDRAVCADLAPQRRLDAALARDPRPRPGRRAARRRHRLGRGRAGLLGVLDDPDRARGVDRAHRDRAARRLHAVPRPGLPRHDDQGARRGQRGAAGRRARKRPGIRRQALDRVRLGRHGARRPLRRGRRDRRPPAAHGSDRVRGRLLPPRRTRHGARGSRSTAPCRSGSPPGARARWTSRAAGATPSTRTGRSPTGRPSRRSGPTSPPPASGSGGTRPPRARPAGRGSPRRPTAASRRTAPTRSRARRRRSPSASPSSTTPGSGTSPASSATRTTPTSTPRSRRARSSASRPILDALR